MPTIRVETIIKASLEACFDLARDSKVHEMTTTNSKERVVAILRDGTVTDATLLEFGDEVTFEARHLGVRQRLTSKIVAYDRPREFVDEMQKGAFKRLRHVHRFDSMEGGTSMVDILEFESPLGPLGRIVDSAFLAGYMRRFVAKRGIELKRLAESSPDREGPGHHLRDA